MIESLAVLSRLLVDGPAVNLKLNMMMNHDDDVELTLTVCTVTE